MCCAKYTEKGLQFYSVTLFLYMVSRVGLGPTTYGLKGAWEVKELQVFQQLSFTKINQT
jgi:hypothetical protein